MSDVEQVLKIKEIADVRDAIHGIEEIQNALSKLEIKPTMRAGFDKEFQNIERQIEKASAAMATGFKNKGDVQRYNNALIQIGNSYNNIISKVEFLKTQKVKFNFDTEEVKKIRTELESLEKARDIAKGTVEAISEVLGKSTKLKDVLDRRAGSSKGGQWKEIFDNLNVDNIDKAIKKVEELQSKIDKGLAGGQKDTYWKGMQADLNVVKAEIDGYTKAVKEQSDAEEKVTIKTRELDEAMHAVGTELNVASSAAKTGARDFNAYAKDASSAAANTQQLNSELDHFKSKTAYFFGIVNGINLFKRALRSAYNTVKDLDKVMTETAVVTNFDVGDMWSQLPEYTQRANELGVSIHSAYEAATIFYQQGLKTNEVMAVSNETLKMARIAGLDAATASDRMTNALRGFNMEMDKVSAQRVNDVYSKLAAITASNTDEISTAMTKVASLAHNANMEFETTSAFLAQMIETTRESAETAGTALKTVVARFSEVKKLYSKGELMGQDEEGGEIDVNKVSTALRSAGINLNEYLTGAKGLDDIFIELASKWDSLDKVQQRYIATMAAGSRQQSRFIAMMSDYKRTMELVNAANNANGASQEQYGKTLDSLETKLARLKNAWNEFVLGLANSDAIKGAVDLLTNFLTAINKVISALSGKNAGKKMIISFFAAFSAFKLGSNLVGKNNAIAKIFTTLTEASRSKVEQSADVIAGVYTNGLKKSLNNGLKNKWNKSALLNYFSPQVSIDKKNLRGGLYKLDAIKNANINQKIAINAAVSTGDIEQVNKALKEQGIQLQLNEQDAEKLGITTQGVAKRSADVWRIAGAAATAFGAILIGLGDKIEKRGEDFEALGIIVKSLGVGLVTFGTILSVTLPLQAALGARAISASIYGIPIVGWISAIISAVVALGVAFYNFGKNNSVETRLEKATKDAKAAANAAEEAREAYKKLSQSWDDLANKYKVIEDATKGTQEWRDAVKQVNDEVLNLISNYEGLEIKRDEKGILHITNQEEFTSAERDRAFIAEGAARVAKGREYKASLAVQDKELWDPDSHLEKEKPYHALISRAIKEGYLKEVASMDDDQIKALFEKDNLLGVQGPSDDKESKRHFANNVRDYARKYSETQDAIKTQNTAFGATILSNSQISDEAKKYANGFLSDKYIENLLTKNRKFHENKGSDKVKADYAEARGYKDFKSLEEADSNVKDLSQAQMVDYLTTRDALKEANKQLGKFANNLNKLSSEQKALLAGQNGEGITQEQLDKLANYTQEDKTKLFTDLGGDDTFGDFRSFEEWFKEALESATKNFDTSKFSTEFVKGLDTELTGNLDSGTYKKFVDNLWSVYTASGEEGVVNIQKSIKDMAKKAQLDSDDLKDFIKSLDGIDWTSTNSIRTLSELAKEYGISEDEANELEEQIIKLNNAATQIDLTKVTEQLQSLLGLGNKINTGTQGRGFTKEQYEQLTTQAGMDANKFSYNISTGNYEYIGDSIQDVVDAINRQTDLMFDTEQLKKDVASGETANALLDGKSSQDMDMGEKTALIRNYRSGADDNSKISEEMFNYAIEQATKNQDYTVIDKLVAIIQKEADELPGKLEKLNKYNFDKDVMKAQMNTGLNNAHAANDGNEAAKKALLTQLASSNMSENVKQELYTGMSSNELNKYGYTKQDYVRAAGNIVDVSTQAQSFGIKQEELDAYVNSLRQLENLQNTEIDKLYQLGLAEMNYQKGQQSLYDSYDEWSKLIQKNGGIVPDGSIEQGRIFNKLNEDLKQMLNLTEKLPDDFLKSKDNVDLLKKAVKGDKDAVEKLRTAAAKVQLGKIDIRDKDLKNNITNKIDELSKKMPDLKIGATLDSTDAGKGLMEFVNKAGMSVEDIQKLFNSLGWAPDIKWVDLSYEDAQKIAQTGTVYQRNPDGSYEPVKLDGEEKLDATQNFSIPQIGPKTSKVAPRPPKKSSKKGGKGKGKGGGKKKAKAKKERWENPYDELYNLQEKINEALRKREALERRYQKLLKQEQTSLSDIRKSYYDQIKQIRTEASLQKELEAGRARQINNIGKETYVDSKGKVKTFDQMGVTKYAKYNFKTGQIEMDWAGIQALEGTKNVEKGKAVEAYVSKLEELVKSYEEVRDKLWELEDKIEEYRQAVIDTFLSFEDRVLDAVINKYQKEIDSYQAMSDAIDKVNNEVLSSLREQIDLSRQIRDNTKKEEDISKKENRLAYLRRDTSGANDLEILSLEKELKDAREGYADTLVDQTIDKLQDDADKASEQRQRQIETMQAQLDIAKETGALWQEVYDLMQDAAKSEIFSSDSELAKLLKDGEAFKALSNIGQAKWWEEVGKSFREAIIGRDEAEDKYKTDADNNGTVANTGTSDYLKEIGEMNTQANVTADSYERTDEQNYGAAAAIVMGGKTHGGWGAKNTNWASNLKEKGFDSGLVLDLVDIFNKQKADWDKEQTALQKKKGKYKKGKNKGKWKYTKKAWTGWKTMGVTDWKKYQMSQFKTGGLADTTGPAWLDGTKTNPELVLNAKDTRNFIALKDILASLMNTQKTKPSASSGDNYFDINIQADIGSDYDVDKLASRIKKIIFEDGQYRNVNTINYLR